ncbi:hypothetical protein ACF0H5_006720 [Mactra antiquata]
MESKEQLNVSAVKRPTAISRHRVISCILFGIGFLLLFFASYAANIFHGTSYGVPYYVGAIISGIPIILLSCIGGAIYYKGQNIGKALYIAPLLVMTVKPLMLCYMIMAPIVVVCCLTGLILTAIYGLCTGDQCSYTDNANMNLGVAAFIFTLEMISILIVIFSFVLTVRYARYFDITFKLRLRKTHHQGTIAVKPQVDEVVEAQQMYTLQKWKLRLTAQHMLINFIKVSEYRQKARKAKNEQNSHI